MTSPEDFQRYFDIRRSADMRAIKRWQEAHPGNDLVWPDHADMVMWLLEQVEDPTLVRPSLQDMDIFLRSMAEASNMSLEDCQLMEDAANALERYFRKSEG